MITVRNDVVQATNSQQIPWDHSALASRFFFKEGPAADPGRQWTQAERSRGALGRVRDTSNPELLEHFIALYGDTPFAAEAQTRLASLGPSTSHTRGTITTAPAPETRSGASRPSFECLCPHSDVEVTICNKPDLSALDNELDRIYTQAIRSLSGTKVMALVQDQRSWIAKRNACGTDVNCLPGKRRPDTELSPPIRQRHRSLKLRRASIAPAACYLPRSVSAGSRSWPSSISLWTSFIRRS